MKQPWLEHSGAPPVHHSAFAPPDSRCMGARAQFPARKPWNYLCGSFRPQAKSAVQRSGRGRQTKGGKKGGAAGKKGSGAGKKSSAADKQAESSEEENGGQDAGGPKKAPTKKAAGGGGGKSAGGAAHAARHSSRIATRRHRREAGTSEAVSCGCTLAAVVMAAKQQGSRLCRCAWHCRSKMTAAALPFVVQQPVAAPQCCLQECLAAIKACGKSTHHN